MDPMSLRHPVLNLLHKMAIELTFEHIYTYIHIYICDLLNLLYKMVIDLTV